jgi:hypothetical protein
MNTHDTPFQAWALLVGRLLLAAVGAGPIALDARRSAGD